MKNISVIIPAWNEEATISEVIRKAFNSKLTKEVLVIDDDSTDNTVSVALLSGACVIGSAEKGKGISMQEGVRLATGDYLVFLDADIPTYPEDIVDLMANPLIEGNIDFVKSCFDRQAGRVTELLAKPLLDIYFPELNQFSQPLSGIVSGKRSFLENIVFENDYGVDIGLLIDMYQANARIAEVNIGYVENKMKPLQSLGNMAKEVTRAIMNRAEADTTYHAVPHQSVIGGLRAELNPALKHKVVVFDMDRTILSDSFIQTAARHFGFEKALRKIALEYVNPVIRTKEIAKLMKGHTIAEIIEVLDMIPITPDFEQTVQALKQKGCVIGIVSDSYSLVTNHLMHRFQLDFTMANDLEFWRGNTTGEVKIPSAFFRHHEAKCKHDYCKSHVISYVSAALGLTLDEIMVIGDGENDMCMVQKAGLGFSFCASHPALELVADVVLRERRFEPMLAYVE